MTESSGITLFIVPGSCSRVPTIALEELGMPFTARAIHFAEREHKSDAYRRINPKGKVPVLLIDGQALTENVAILLYLNNIYPAGGVLPVATDTLARARQVADLCFCSATLHPIVTRMRIPTFFAPADAIDAVRALADLAMREYFDLIEARLADAPWWYGDAWSVMDAYLYWVFGRVEGAGFDVSSYPRFAAHRDAMEQRPAVGRALARERDAARELEQDGARLTMPILAPRLSKNPVQLLEKN